MSCFKSQQSIKKNNPLHQKSPNLPAPRSLFLILILLIATGLRLYDLSTLPPGLNFDEAGNGVAALDILRGEPQLWWRIGGGKEPLWPYLIALSTTLLGQTPLALRLPAALVGILTVAAVYPLLRSLFRSVTPHANLIALLTMLGLALSAWHLHFSRLGFRAVLLPLLSTLAFYFFWQGIIRPHPASGPQSSPSSLFRTLRFTFYASRFPVAALFTALAIYAYLAGRLLPLVPLLFLFLQWIVSQFHHRLYKKQPPPGPPEGGEKTEIPPSGGLLGGRPNLQSLISNYYLPLLLCLLPLIIYFLLNPADFVARAGTVSLFNPEQNNGDLLGTAWRTLTLTLGTFLGLTGDPNPLVNLPQQAAVPLFLTPFFFLGFVINIYHACRPIFFSAPLLLCPSPHLFLLCWWVVMLLPALLAPEGAPHHLRLLGTIIPTYTFIALGITTAISFLANRFPLPASCSLLSALRFLLPTLCYLLLAAQTVNHYFIRWPTTDFTLTFDRYAVGLAEEMAQAPPQTGYVLLMDIRAAAEARHYTLDYLLAGQPTAYAYLPVDERNAETGLTAAAQERTELRVVRWRQDKHQAADEKEIVIYLLETHGEKVGQEESAVYGVETYEVERGTDFKLPPINQPLGAVFDALLQLDAAFVPPTVTAGEPLPVALTLAPLAPIEVDYRASLRLIGPDGARIAQKDRTLRHDFHQGTSLWPPETVNEYYLLPLSPETSPGVYSVALVIYHPQTQAPLVAEGLVEVLVGMVRVESPP